MLNFKKKGIFTRQAPKEDALPQQEPQDGILAVWGSPGSGKTTVAVKIAKYLADRKKNVVLLLCDMTAPMRSGHCGTRANRNQNIPLTRTMRLFPRRK